MSPSSEDLLRAFIQKRFQEKHSAKKQAASSGPIGEAGHDPWETFQGIGLNVDRLRTLEEQSILGQPSRPASKNPIDQNFLKSREKLLQHFPVDRVLKAKSSKLSPPAPHPNDLPGGTYPGVTYFGLSSVQGSGLGWSKADSEADGWIASWDYEFVPPQDGIYLISSFPAAWGHVWGHAHDRWWNSKEFHLRIGSCLGSYQGASIGIPGEIQEIGGFLPYFVGTGPGYDGQMMFESEHGNYTLNTEVTCPEQLQIQTFLNGDKATLISCSIVADAYAQGAGAYCGFSLGFGVVLTAWQLIETL